MASNNSNGAVLVRVENLKKYFPIMRGMLFSRQVGAVKAVDDVSFYIKRGETLGLVGESGCGKTTTGHCILQLHQPTSGKVLFEGQDLVQMKGEVLRKMRRQMQLIFQDPFASLDPRMTAGDIIGEPLLVLLFAVVQLPPILVLGPIIVWAFAAKSTGVAIVFAIWTTAVALSDNVLKPLLLGRGASVPMAVIFIGAIGGFVRAGIIGLFVGAVVLAVGYELFKWWLENPPPEAQRT